MNAGVAASPQTQRLIALSVCVALAVSYAISLLMGGHGVVPIGIALFIFADQVTAGLEQPLIFGALTAGWSGLVILLVSLGLLRFGRAHAAAAVIAALLLYLSWLCFAWQTSEAGSDNRFSTYFLTHLVVSAPFQGMFGYVLFRSAPVLLNAGRRS